MSAWLLRTSRGNPAASTFTDNFSGTANPLAAPWYNNSTAKWSPLQKTPGLCSGTQPTHAPRFDDSFALMAGFNQRSQFVQTTMKLAAGVGTGGDNGTHEVALHLGMTSSATGFTGSTAFAQGYEINIGFAGDPSNSANGYAQIIAWKTGDNNSIGDFDIMTNLGITIANNDVFKATMVWNGSNNIFNIYKNGALIVGPFTDVTYAFQGDPGIGTFWGNTGNQADYGMSSVTLGNFP